MEMGVYSVKDNKTGNMRVPFYSPDDIQAKRSFYQAIKDPQSQLSVFINDFELWKFGTYDEATGDFTLGKPEFIINAKSMKETVDNENT